MSQGSYRPHLSAANGDPRHQETRRVVIYEAVQATMLEHEVSEMTAYGMLVQTAVDARSSVRETARRILARSD